MIDPIGIAPGQYVTATDGLTTKQLILADTSFDVLDPDFNKGSGTGPANEEARVYIDTDQGDYEYVLTVEPDGTWSIDYGALGFTFNEVYYASVNIVDEDSDTTREHFYPPSQPRILVQLGNNRIEGMNWPFGQEVSITIDDDYDPGNGVLYQTSEVSYINPGYSDTEGFVDHQPEGYTIQAGDVVTLDDGNTIRVLEVADLGVTNIDIENDVVTGYAPAGRVCFIQHLDTGICLS